MWAEGMGNCIRKKNREIGNRHLFLAWRVFTPDTHADPLTPAKPQSTLHFVRMDRNNWYPQQDYDPRRAQGSPRAPTERVAADSVQDAQTLLAVYPMASATPSDYGKPSIGPYRCPLLTRAYTDNMTN
jgi:hypothetical protein